MDYGPMFESIRAGTAVPVRYISEFLVGRENEKKAIENDIDYVITGNSKVRVFLGDYGYGKSSLARYAEHLAENRGMIVSYMTEKDYEYIHKQDEFFKSIMKNLKLIGVEGNPVKIFMDAWAQQEISEIKKANLEFENTEEIKSYLQGKNDSFTSGLFGQYSAAYLNSVLKNERTEEYIAYLMGDHVDKRFLKKNGIFHFLENDGWNFLKAFTTLMRTLEIPGLVIIMDELESTMNKRKDIRDKGYNQLREIVDKLNGGTVERAYCIWLGTPVWFDNGHKGVASYSALFNRLDNASGVQTSNSILMKLKPVTAANVKELIGRIFELYISTYNVRLPKDSIEKIFKAIGNFFRGIDGTVRVSTREIVKYIVEILDTLKDNPSSKLDKVLEVSLSGGSNDSDPLEGLWE